MVQKIHAGAAILSLLLAACVDSPDSSANDAKFRPQIADGQAPAQRTAAPDGKLIADAIQAHLGQRAILGENSRLKTAWSDLDGDGRDEAIVHVTDPAMCGTGGCNLFILAGDDRRWEVIDELTITHLPIYRLAPGADGWAELGVTVAGGGLARMVMAVPHGPNGYAHNPTVPPARSIDPKDAKQLLTDD